MCKRYPIYWAIRWLYTKDSVSIKQTKRRFPNYAHIHRRFDMVYAQDEYLEAKSRRLQFTWTGLAICLHYFLFYDGVYIVEQSIKEEVSKKLIGKTAFMLHHLPDFFLRGHRFIPNVDIQQLKIVAPWGSEIHGVQQGADHLRGDTVTFWFCDEAAIQPKFDDALTGSLPALEGGGKFMIGSSVKPSHFWDTVNDIGYVDGSGYMTDDGTSYEKIFPMKGVEEWKNRGNGFYVVRMHYSADPRKDPDTKEGAAWKEKEQRKYRDDIRRWNQEYEIDGSALGASLVYPQFSIKNHYLPNLKIEDIPKHWTRYFAMDPGVDAPTACLWAAVSPEGAIFVYDEYYVRDRTIPQHAGDLLHREKMHPGPPQFRFIDPHACKRQYSTETCRDQYIREGIYCISANNDVDHGIDLVRSYLGAAKVQLTEEEIAEGKKENPLRVYFLNTPKTFMEFRKYMMAENESDKPKKGNDHLMDALRYIIASGPTYIEEKDDDGWVDYVDPLTGICLPYQEEDYG